MRIYWIHMTPDANREWYIYFKEQEMGPLSETQLKVQFQGGELDSSAFVFTEGMADWTAIEEVELLVEKSEDSESESVASATSVTVPPPEVDAVDVEVEEQELAGLTDSDVFPAQEDLSAANLHTSANLSVETLGGANEEAVPDIFNPEVSQDSGNNLTDQTQKEFGAKQTKSRKLKTLRWLFLGFVGLIFVGVFLDYSGMTKQGRPEILKWVLGEPNELSGKKSGEVSPDDVSANANNVVPATESTVDKMWAELGELRSTESEQGVPFRISSELISPSKPIITGAISPLIDTEEIHIVVYPDLSRNLMKSPRFWWLSLPVIDGYFAGGPLSIRGENLPVGVYRMMAQADGRYLGTVAFEIGEFPAGPDLDVAKKDLQNSYLMAASREQKEIEEAFRSLETLYDALRKNSVQYALKGKARRSAWNKSKIAWNKAFEQTSIAIGKSASLTYYPGEQAKLSDFSKELLKTLGLMDLYNSKGRKTFEKRAGARYSSIWNNLKKEKEFLKSDISNLEGQKVMSPTIDEELLKANLLNVR